jgi:tRNA(Ile)-lysidine synthase
MDQFEQDVAAFVERHALVPTDAKVGVAVSGGADSVCLLLVLQALCQRWGATLQVLHVNHSLRGQESDADAAFVEGLTRELCLPFHLHTIPATEVPSTGLEAWARGRRREFFRGMLRAGTVERIATGHHEGDQAETVLFRLLRGAGSHGLGGIAPFAAPGMIRPLLAQSRESILKYLRSKGANWRTDATNADVQFARNSLRHEWIPALAEKWNSKLESVLASTAEQLRDESALLAEMAADHFQRLFSREVYGWVAQREALAALPVALQRRVLIHAARVAANDLPDEGEVWLTQLDAGLDFRQVEAVRHLFTVKIASGKHRVHGLHFERSGSHVRITKESAFEAEPADPILIGEGQSGCFQPRGSERAVEIRYLTGSQTDNPLDRDGKSGYTDGWSFLETIRLRFPLILRQWREGDAYQPIGAKSKRKLKRLFQRRGIPHWKRRDELILESEGEVIWSSSFGVSAERLATCVGSTTLALRVRNSGKHGESS